VCQKSTAAPKIPIGPRFATKKSTGKDQKSTTPLKKHVCWAYSMISSKSDPRNDKKSILIKKSEKTIKKHQKCDFEGGGPWGTPFFGAADPI
jgi:hypothetical protein